MPSALSNTFLKSGGKIGVMAPSSYVDQADIEASKAALEARGFSVFIHPQTYERSGQSAGNTLQKSLAFQGLMQRKDIDLIWFAGGGNQSLPLLESIHFEKITTVKPVCGFSDNTSIINAMAARCGGVHYHAPVFKMLGNMPGEHLDEVLSVLTGSVRKLDFTAAQIMRSGKTSGRLIGGNLSIAQYLPSLLGDDYINGSILFLEDCHEEISRIDRMFSYLRQSGVLKRISGLLLGQFTDLTDSGRPFGMTLDEIIMHHMDGFDVSIVTGLPFGHKQKERFFPLPVGGLIEIDSDSAAMKW